MRQEYVEFPGAFKSQTTSKFTKTGRNKNISFFHVCRDPKVHRDPWPGDRAFIKVCVIYL
ncbi:hypothetical protein MPTK1_4g19860 [Marchantia polymorpha subsp. ruderalis]|uniref:Uncharacterized protein n=2 Tax=Marchantia polymorpha TaxID=3197 RepID=A0AAF6BBS1_MARPO|nr:hypothetical protein MARPO_0126s0008 [Marchantia polymorpha]BBN09455.1 hypothetical protein Mp_4g19860 [Marchantia polymorpha subsp. ruderalis]|eukprot:PTQ30287.1 hypothetical protein MARPO_0126s0008 [Marchantia polymorpha]